MNFGKPAFFGGFPNFIRGFPAATLPELGCLVLGAMFPQPGGTWWEDGTSHWHPEHGHGSQCQLRPLCRVLL